MMNYQLKASGISGKFSQQTRKVLQRIKRLSQYSRIHLHNNPEKIHSKLTKFHSIFVKIIRIQNFNSYPYFQYLFTLVLFKKRLKPITRPYFELSLPLNEKRWKQIGKVLQQTGNFSRSIAKVSQRKFAVKYQSTVLRQRLTHFLKILEIFKFQNY